MGYQPPPAKSAKSAKSEAILAVQTGYRANDQPLETLYIRSAFTSTSNFDGVRIKTKIRKSEKLCFAGYSAMLFVDGYRVGPIVRTLSTQSH